MNELSATLKAIEIIKADPRITSRELAIIDKKLAEAALKAAASILRPMGRQRS